MSEDAASFGDGREKSKSPKLESSPPEEKAYLLEKTAALMVERALESI